MNQDRILILDLIDILKLYSDKNNPLKQSDIIALLEEKYNYNKVRDKTIGSNLKKIIEHYEYDQNLIRLRAEDFEEDEEIGYKDRRITDIYYNHTFLDSELSLIIDTLLFSKQIPVKEREILIKKLETLSSKNFKSRKGNITFESSRSLENNEDNYRSLFENIALIDQAIDESKKISFQYSTYLIENNEVTQSFRKNKNQEIRNYIINPYHMAASNGRYYLICNNDKFDNLSTYRVDRMRNIKILNQKRKPRHEIEGLGDNFSLNKYMSENIYMFSGETESIKLSVDPLFLDELTDWFSPKDISVLDVKDQEIIVSIKSNKKSIMNWALRYALFVKVLAPDDLVKEIKENLEQSLENYNPL